MNPRELQQLPGNATCADCPASATWASVNLGVLLCIDCSGVHRSLGTHITTVKSITLDTWRAEWVDRVRVVGNEHSNSFYERRIPPKYQALYARRGTSRAERDRFIKLKYVQRRFAPTGSAPHELIGQGLVLPSEYPEPDPAASDDDEDVPAVTSPTISDQQAGNFTRPHSGPSWSLPFAPPEREQQNSSAFNADAFFDSASAKLEQAQKKSSQAAATAWSKMPTREDVAGTFRGASKPLAAGSGQVAETFSGLKAGFSMFAASAASAASGAMAAASTTASGSTSPTRTAKSQEAPEEGKGWQSQLKTAAKTAQSGFRSSMTLAQQAGSEIMTNVDKLVQAASGPNTVDLSPTSNSQQAAEEASGARPPTASTAATASPACDPPSEDGEAPEMPRSTGSSPLQQSREVKPPESVDLLSGGPAESVDFLSGGPAGDEPTPSVPAERSPAPVEAVSEASNSLLD